MMTEQEPSSTRLFDIPVEFPNGDGNLVKSKLLIYTNDLQLGATSTPSDRRTANPNEYSWLNQSTRTRDGSNEISPYIANLVGTDVTTVNEALMIVPIPNTTRTQEFGLVDIRTDEMKRFRRICVDRCKSLLPQARSLSYGARGMTDGMHSNSLQVHRVGNYDISVAPDLDALEKQVDWKHFKLPADFQTRKSTLSDKKLYPFPCAYVVAKAVQNVKDDGFGVIYPDPGFDYFPTAHENGKRAYDYDVNVYNFSNRPLSSVPFFMDGKQHNMHTYRLEAETNVQTDSDMDDYDLACDSPFDDVTSAWQSVSKWAVNSKTGRKIVFFTSSEGFRYVNFTPIGSHVASQVRNAINQNIIISRT